MGRGLLRGLYLGEVEAGDCVERVTSSADSVAADSVYGESAERPLRAESSGLRFSLEFFPPKKDDDLPQTKALMERLARHKPVAMTVTYGAGGGTRGRTQELVHFIANTLRVPSVAHLTCVGHTAQEIGEILTRLEDSGVRMVLALRGDPPKDSTVNPYPEGGFNCARDLSRYIVKRGGFSIAVAGYPETHPDAVSPEAEISYLAEKVEAGGEVILTQLFFEPELYASFVARAKAAGISVPIIPGIIPIANVGQLERFTKQCGASLPKDLLKQLDGIRNNNQAVEAFGVDYAVKQCRALLELGAPALHFYTLNRSNQVEEILSQLEG